MKVRFAHIFSIYFYFYNILIDIIFFNTIIIIIYIIDAIITIGIIMIFGGIKTVVNVIWGRVVCCDVDGR